MSKSHINLLASQLVSLKSGIDELNSKLAEKQKKLAQTEQKILSYLKERYLDTVSTEVGSISKDSEKIVIKQNKGVIR